MSLGATHEMWRDSVPVTSFPFRYHDRAHGTIVQTWADVKEKLGRDAQSQALPFSPAHIAPSQLHSNIIAAINRKEEQNRERLEQRIAERSTAGLTRPASAPTSRRGGSVPSRPPQTTAEVMSQLVAAPGRRGTAGQSAPPATPAAVRPTAPPVKPQRPMSAVERRVLTEGDGDGTHGRQAYLRLRRRLPLQHRTNYRRTSSQSYGWELLDFTETATAPQQQEAALMQAVAQSVRLGGGAKRPAPGGIAAEAATVATATAAANRRTKPVPEFTKAAVGSAAAAAPAAVAAKQKEKEKDATSEAAQTAAAGAPMRMTAIGTMVRAHSSGQREPGQAEYFGRRSFMNQLARRTGVFSRGDV